MNLPAPVRRRVEAQVGPVREARAVGGGCISHAVRLDLAKGRAFLKYNTHAPDGLFTAEAEGLARLRGAVEDLRIPEVLGVWEAERGGTVGEPSWILLEWLEPASSRPAGYSARLGRGLAQLHRTTAEDWGGVEDGFIGPLPQSNVVERSWASFWQERRLEPQLRRAREAGWLPGEFREWERLLSALPALLSGAEREGPSLLHGDLWSGNVLTVEQGVPALIDPAVYFGHREVDLAMSELFGGFDAAFYDAYGDAWPLLSGYREGRRSVYQLYYLLVHVNLFGGSYVAQTNRLLQSLLAAL